MENEKINRINTFLNEHGASIDTIPSARKIQFEKIDEAIQKRASELLKAKDILKNNTINISTIAIDTDIARKTFYNNELLKVYVEEYSLLFEDKSMAYTEEIERLKAKIKELEEQIHKFLIRDVETENLRHENMKLQLEIQHFQDRNNSLEEQYAKLQNNYEELRKKPTKVEIIKPFNK